MAPLSSPTGITTAEACLAQCNSAASCQSFLFGLLNGVPTCELFNVAASALPATTNFVAYDKACTSVPAIVPTTANPTGVDVSGDQSTGSTPSTGNGSTGAGTTDVSGDQNTGSNAATEKHARNVNSDNSGDPSTGAAVLASPPTAPTVVTGATHASPLNGIPAAGQAPIALGSGLANWNSLFCLAACKVNAHELPPFPCMHR